MKLSHIDFQFQLLSKNGRGLEEVEKSDRNQFRMHFCQIENVLMKLILLPSVEVTTTTSSSSPTLHLCRHEMDVLVGYSKLVSVKTF